MTRGCVQESSIADVQTDVGVSLAQRIEKDQVADGELVCRNCQADAADLIGPGWQFDTGGGAKNISNQTAAVEASRRIAAAKPVRHADQTKRLQRQFLASRRNVDHHLRLRRRAEHQGDGNCAGGAPQTSRRMPER